MSSHERAGSAKILPQIRELASSISDERTSLLVQNVTGALEVDPSADSRRDSQKGARARGAQRPTAPSLGGRRKLTLSA
jgi:hypothetical protein